eukprot:9007119-Alexandrium_andersonii.AAC.1
MAVLEVWQGFPALRQDHAQGAVKGGSNIRHPKYHSEPCMLFAPIRIWSRAWLFWGFGRASRPCEKTTLLAGGCQGSPKLDARSMNCSPPAPRQARRLSRWGMPRSGSG